MKKVIKLKGSVEIELRKEGDGVGQNRVSVIVQGTDVVSMSVLDFLYHQGLATAEKEGDGISCIRSHPERLEFYKNGKRLAYINSMRSIERKLWTLMEDELGAGKSEKAILDYLYLEPLFSLYSTSFDGERGCCKAFYEDRIRGNSPIGPDGLDFDDFMEKCPQNQNRIKIWKFAGCFYDEEGRLRPRHEAVFVRQAGDIKNQFLHFVKICIPPLLGGMLCFIMPSDNLLAGFSSDEAAADWMKERGIEAGTDREDILRSLADWDVRSAILKEAEKPDRILDITCMIMGSRDPFRNVPNNMLGDKVYQEIIKYRNELERRL